VWVGTSSCANRSWRHPVPLQRLRPSCVTVASPRNLAGPASPGPFSRRESGNPEPSKWSARDWGGHSQRRKPGLGSRTPTRRGGGGLLLGACHRPIAGVDPVARRGPALSRPLSPTSIRRAFGGHARSRRALRAAGARGSYGRVPSGRPQALGPAADRSAPSPDRARRGLLYRLHRHERSRTRARGLGAPPPARFGPASAQLRTALAVLQPGPREAGHSACTPALAAWAGFQARLPRACNPCPRRQT